MLRADEARCARGLDGVLGRAGAPHVEGHCGRAGAKKAWALAADLDALASAEPPEREVLLLAGHDPYLDQRDRATLQVDVSLQRRIWKTVANPGVVVRNGEAVGTWTAKKKGAGLSVSLATWVACSEQKLRDLAEAYAAFRGLKLLGVSFE